MPTEARPHPTPLDEARDDVGVPPAEAPIIDGDLPLMTPSPLTLCFAPEIELTDDLFWKICAANPDLRLERTAEGNLEIMYPAGGESSRQNSTLTMRLGIWNEGRGDEAGVCFDSSAGFKLPSGATKGPDASWIARDRWLALTPAQRRVFPPICPDFVAELRSPSDSKRKVREKLREYLDNGARLGWLIDPIDGTVEIYRPGREPETLTGPERIDGGDVLPGFVLELRGILFD
jgi:Uma2 family endonuclease